MIQGAYTGIGSQQLIFPSSEETPERCFFGLSPQWGEKSGRTEEHLALPTFNCGNPIFNASGGIVVDVPKGKLRDELSSLLKKPEYAYLKTLKANNEVQWNEIAFAYQHWHYKQQGLTEAGAAL